MLHANQHYISLYIYIKQKCLSVCLSVCQVWTGAGGGDGEGGQEGGGQWGRGDFTDGMAG